jgi:branched-chain amino acid transport system ATP-binding protein
VFQTPEIFADLTLLENVDDPGHGEARRTVPCVLSQGSIRRRRSGTKALHMLEDVGLADKKDVHSGSLSRGDKRRLELAMCLSQHPKLLLLDEPTAGMSRADTNNTIDLLKSIKERGITKVVIEHDMHVVFSLADKVTVLAQGTHHRRRQTGGDQEAIRASGSLPRRGAEV